MYKACATIAGVLMRPIQVGEYLLFQFRERGSTNVIPCVANDEEAMRALTELVGRPVLLGGQAEDGDTGRIILIRVEFAIGIEGSEEDRDDPIEIKKKRGIQKHEESNVFTIRRGHRHDFDWRAFDRAKRKRRDACCNEC